MSSSTNISAKSLTTDDRRSHGIVLRKYMATPWTRFVNVVLAYSSLAAAAYMPTTGSDPSFLVLFIYLSVLSQAPVRFRDVGLPYLPPVYYATGAVSFASLLWGLYATGDSSSPVYYWGRQAETITDSEAIYVVCFTVLYGALVVVITPVLYDPWMICLNG
ncbi:hypothetical protein EUX98_g6376 [Antrodiella citrinella]|uniref:Uncharacterized protein n=1 Tax=Antrodiella citrinella TaxID=2447956 RepID=A0A4S4MP98_9APHY|nr:hypothetical protein EUX98_g6376 [Antrodiella citrinella]